MMKSNKAITLIALIITIIVLLVLAGVTINMVLGDNGLFNKAKTSVAKYENAQEKENSTLIEYEQGIDNVRETVTISKEEYNQMKAQINALSNYSKDEQAVGTWIDGKPIYQITLSGVIVPSDKTVIINDVDRVINAFGSQTYGPNSEPFQFPYIGNSARIRWVKNTSNQIYVENTYTDELWEYSWTFQYTKTTDSATI